MKLILIGYRGTGKTTVARCLARRLGWSWMDTDDEIERSAGKSIAAIFRDDGEATFRDLESDVLADWADKEQVVLATGGGAVLRERNRRALHHGGTIVWLTASPPTILKRISADRTTAQRRPKLTSAGPEAEVSQTLEARSPIYRDCADLEIDTEGKTPPEIADEVLRQLGWSSRQEPK